MSISKKVFSFPLIILFLLAAIVLPYFSGKVLATGYCEASVSPSNVSPNSTGSLTFSINNNGWTNGVIWVKITSPSSNFTINSGTKSGWSASGTGSSITFTGGTQGLGVTTGYTLDVSATSELAQTAWTVETSDAADGSGSVSCAGETRVAISANPADVTPPNITTDIGITSNDTSATLTWTTDEAATSVTNYGTTSDYGQSVSETTAVTSHSVTLSSLSANTNYHFSITNTDVWGNSSTSVDSTFTLFQTTKSVTVTTTTNITKTETVTKLVADTTLPAIKLTTKLTGAYKTAPEISGAATDNAGLSLIEYSIDNGTNWSTVFMDSKIGSKSTTFKFTPDIFDDGNYQIKVRATDTSGNTTTTKASELIIDRLPPIVGASMFSIGPLILNPDINGFLTTSINVPVKVVATEAGGPISVDLSVDNKNYSLTRSPETGLWSGTINFTNQGTYNISAKSIDGAGNTTEENIATIIVIDPGTVVDKNTQKTIKGAILSLFQKDEYTGIWYPWDGSAFNQEEQQVTDDTGKYNYLLPPGEYYFKIEAPGYYGIVSNIFNITNSTAINSKFELSKKTFPIQFNWDKVDVNFNNLSGTTRENSLDKAAIGTEDSNFENLRGKPTLVTFLNTWFPQSIDQLNILDDVYRADNQKYNISGVMVQEKPSKTEVFAKRGNYDLPFIDDPDGTIANSFSVTSLPTHVFMDRNGIIKKIIRKIMTEPEIEENLSLITEGE